MVRALVITLLLILAIVIGWHIFFPLLGGVIAVGAAAWGIILASIVIFCVAVLLVFLFTGIGLLILGLIFAAWTVVAIVLFPIIVPIVLPLFLIFLFLSLFRRRTPPTK